MWYNNYHKILSGEMAERSNAHPWKGCIRAIVSEVRILFSPLRILLLATKDIEQALSSKNLIIYLYEKTTNWHCPR